MAISAVKHEALKAALASKVEQFIVDGLQDWGQAASDAITEARDPDADDSAIYWIFTLIGNLMWAATVFFPPAAVIGEITIATKVASVVGASLGADTVGKMFRMAPTVENAKTFLRDLIARKRVALRQLYIAEANDFTRGPFAHWVTQSMLVLAKRNFQREHLIDDDVDRFLSNVTAISEMRLFVLRTLLFPGGTIDPIDSQGSLRTVMRDQMNRALVSFDRQYDDWNTAKWAFIGPRGSDFLLNTFMSQRYSLSALAARYEQDHPFNPRISFDGPAKQPWFPFGPPTVENRLAAQWQRKV